jgi:hypothetical protein
VDPFSGDDTAERRRIEPTSLPRRRATASEHPRQFRLARHLPLFPRELSLPDSPHLVARLDAARHASPPLRAWPPRGEHGWCTRSAPHPSQPGQVAAGPCGRPPCHRTQAGFTRALQAVGRFEGRHCAAIFSCFSIDLIPRK